MKFLQSLLASVLGFFIAMILMFFFFILIGVLVGSSMDDEVVAVDSPSVLEFTLNSELLDYYAESDQGLLQFLELDSPYMGLNAIIHAIQSAKNDPMIKAISIEMNDLSAGMAQMKSLRRAIEDFKDSGKSVYAYADVYSQNAYYLASVADRVFLNPVGDLTWDGLQSEVLFFKEFEDNYGVKMEVVRHGKYKSAMEPFISNKMSDANREQISEMQGDIWSEILKDISISRDLSPSKLQNIADNSLARSPEKARNVGLVDELIYYRSYKNYLSENVLDDAEYEGVSLTDYMVSVGSDETYKSDGNIAVLYAQGEIIYGYGDVFTIGNELMQNTIEELKEDDTVKAVVLRVDSPGGSALASDIILEALEDLNQVKPLVVSMGNYAASGGYYIACKGDRIFAEAATITGSIGVFGALPNVSGMASKIGINAEQVSTSKAPSYSLFEPLSKEYYDLTKSGIERVYDDFLTNVAEGRNMTKAQVNEVAQGRVWTGNQALEKGLVDEIGSLDQAIAHAAELAELEVYGRYNYPEHEQDLANSFQQLPLLQSDFIQEYLKLIPYSELEEMKSFSKLNGIQARMPYRIMFF